MTMQKIEGSFLYEVIGTYKDKNTLFYVVTVCLDEVSLAAIFLIVFQVNKDSVLVFYVVTCT